MPCAVEKSLYLILKFRTRCKPYGSRTIPLKLKGIMSGSQIPTKCSQCVKPKHRERMKVCLLFLVLCLCSTYKALSAVSLSWYEIHVQCDS